MAKYINMLCPFNSTWSGSCATLKDVTPGTLNVLRLLLLVSSSSSSVLSTLFLLVGLNSNPDLPRWLQSHFQHHLSFVQCGNLKWLLWCSWSPEMAQMTYVYLNCLPAGFTIAGSVKASPSGPTVGCLPFCSAVKLQENHLLMFTQVEYSSTLIPSFLDFGFFTVQLYG